MSLAVIEGKPKRISEMKTGVHLAIISDVLYLRNSKKEPILNDKQELTLIVLFKNDKTEKHEQHYSVNKKQMELFKKLLICAGVDMPADGSSPSKKEAIDKRLWIFIREVHHVMDNEPIKDFQGNLIIEHHIFKSVPYTDDMKAPTAPGNPEDNAGVASGVFIDYKNFSVKKAEQVVQQEIMQPEPKKEAPEAIQPLFDNEPTMGGIPVSKEVPPIQTENFNWDDKPKFD